MPKIKNWKKIKSSKKFPRWVNEDYNQQITVQTTKGRGRRKGNWEVVLFDLSNNKNAVISYESKKSRATKKAIKWMRKNPKGNVIKNGEVMGDMYR